MNHARPALLQCSIAVCECECGDDLYRMAQPSGPREPSESKNIQMDTLFFMTAMTVAFSLANLAVLHGI